MGWLKDLLGIREDEEVEEVVEEEALTAGIAFVNSAEEQDYEQSMIAQLRAMDNSKDMENINKYYPSKGMALETQAKAIREALEVIKNQDDEEINRSFEIYKKAFNEWALKARGEQTLSNLKTINSMMKKDFTDPIAKSQLSKSKLRDYIGKIGAVQEAVDSAEDNGETIMEKTTRDIFNEMTLESEYRLKMLEMLLYMSENPEELGGDEMLNPFKNISSSRQQEYAILFNEDMNELAKEYERLSYNSEDIDNYGENHRFSDMDNVVKSFNDDYSIQALGDPTLTQMFKNSESSQLFEFLKKVIYVRYKINEINGEFSNTMETKRTEEERIREETEAEYKRQQEEAQRKLDAEKKAAKMIEKFKNATDEELQGMINAINSDISLEGNKNLQLLDFQMQVARLRGLIPEKNPMESENLEAVYYSASQIIDFVKAANEKGLRYKVFPCSQEFGNERFCVIVPTGSLKDIQIESRTFEFDESHSLDNDLRLRPYKKIGTMPGYFLAEVQKQFDSSSNPQKFQIRDFVCVDKVEPRKAFEMAVYDYSRDEGAEVNGEDAYRFMNKLVKKAKKSLQKVWKSDNEDKNVMCYLSMPVSSNIIPVLRAFKENDIKPYFERRISEENGRNGENRDRINIYFDRKDMDKFYDNVQYQIGPLNYQIHYGRGYNFVDENSTDLKLKEEPEYGEY